MSYLHWFNSKQGLDARLQIFCVFTDSFQYLPCISLRVPNLFSINTSVSIDGADMPDYSNSDKWC